MKPKAIIFDFDGVITDTEPVHMDAWLDTLETAGVSFGEDEYQTHYLGLSDRDFLDAAGKRHGVFFEDAKKRDLIDEKTQKTFRLIEHGIPLMPGIKEFVENASKDKLLAICSGAVRGEIEFVLKKLNWVKLFDPIIASDSVKRGKPDPEGYIRAYDALVARADFALLPEDVMVIEDSPKGIAAAKSAGFYCVAVGTTFSKTDTAAADLRIKTIEELEI